MNYKIYFNCKKLNSNDADAIAEYGKRLSAYCKINWYCKPSKTCPVSSLPAESTHTIWIQIQTAISDLTSEALAEQIEQLGIQGISTVCFFIGYAPMQKTNDCSMQEPITLSLSSMNISQSLTGVILYEQLYRSYRILHQQPYHK